VNAYFESIFEIGVDEMLWDDMHKNDMLWPTVSEVHECRKQVYEPVANAIMTHPSLDDSDGPVTVDQDHPMWALFMGFEHERIHLETSSVLFRETPYHLVQVRINIFWLHRKNATECPYSRSLLFLCTTDSKELALTSSIGRKGDCEVQSCRGRRLSTK
jgi:hypothetical protein